MLNLDGIDHNWYHASCLPVINLSDDYDAASSRLGLICRRTVGLLGSEPCSVDIPFNRRHAVAETNYSVCPHGQKHIRGNC